MLNDMKNDVITIFFPILSIDKNFIKYEAIITLMVKDAMSIDDVFNFLCSTTAEDGQWAFTSKLKVSKAKPEKPR